jgi:drug/metabolite transporter (DMT)-like permease
MNNTSKISSQTLAYLSATLAMLLWSSAFPATRYVLEYYSPWALMLMRFLAASVTLIVIGIIRNIKLPKIKDLPFFIASGFSGVFLYALFFNTGSVTVIAGVGSFIIASAPIFTLILSRILLKEIVKPICYIGVLVSFIGLAAVTLTQITEFTFNFGILLLTFAAICSSVYSIVVRNLSKTYSPLEITTFSIIIGTIAMLIFLPNVITEVPKTNLSVNILVILMGILPSALGYLTWSYALAKADKIAHVMVFSYLIPFLSAIIAYFWLGETLTIYALAGGIIIIVGMIITNVFGKEKNN